MIKHIVLWKLKAFAEGVSKELNAKKIKDAIETLKSKIPQIKHREVGINLKPSDSAYEVALYSEFSNEQDLITYAEHPEHVKIAGFIRNLIENRVVVDYKTD